MLTIYVIKPKPNPSCEDSCMWITFLVQHGFEFARLGSRFREKKRVLEYFCMFVHG